MSEVMERPRLLDRLELRPTDSLLALIALHPAGWNSAGVPLFAAGVVCFIVADIAFAFLVARGAYELGHPVDIFWTSSVALVAF